MRRNWNGIDPQQTNAFRIAHANRFRVGELIFREWYAFAEDTAFPFRGPLRRERKKLLQLIESRLSIHAYCQSRNPAGARQNI